MKWFKFYGQDWLTDTKILSMKIEDRLCYLTLLCLASASETGVIKNCEEGAILHLTNLYLDPYETDNEYTRATGCLKRFEDNKMITIDRYHNVIITNFGKRQGQNLSGYERVKRYREKKKTIENKDKISEGVITNDNFGDNANDNARLDKTRIDKNREENIPFSSFWEIYPKKVGKKKTEQKWLKLDNLQRKKVIEDIPKRKETDRWKKGFIPDPETYINQERWEDDYGAYNDFKKSEEVLFIDYNKK